MSVKEDLIAVKTLLVRDGWCQEEGENDLGEHCVMGAVYEVTYLAPDRLKRFDALKASIRSAAGVPTVSLWNDDPRRTFDEVLSMLDTAIESAS